MKLFLLLVACVAFSSAVPLFGKSAKELYLEKLGLEVDPEFYKYGEIYPQSKMSIFSTPYQYEIPYYGEKLEEISPMMQLYPRSVLTQQPKYQQLKYLLELLKNKEIFQLLAEEYPTIFGRLEYLTIWELKAYLMEYFMKNPIFLEEIMSKLEKIYYLYKLRYPYTMYPYPQTSYNQDLRGLWTMLSRSPMRQMYYYQQPYSMVPKYL